MEKTRKDSHAMFGKYYVAQLKHVQNPIKEEKVEVTFCAKRGSKSFSKTKGPATFAFLLFFHVRKQTKKKKRKY